MPGSILIRGDFRKAEKSKFAKLETNGQLDTPFLNVTIIFSYSTYPKNGTTINLLGILNVLRQNIVLY